MSQEYVFNVETPQSSGESTVNFEEYTKYVIDTIGCAKKPEGQIGIVSQIIQLGKQKQEDAKMKFDGDAAEEARILAEEREKTGKDPVQYFQTLKDEKTKKDQRYKRWPVPAQDCVATLFDVPTKMINRGKFFDTEGVGEDLPFRGLLNNEFFIKGVGKTVSKPYSLREGKVKEGDKDTGRWALAKNSILHKLAAAVEVLDDNGDFKPAHLGKLIGKAALFNVHVFGNEHNGKTYLTEKMSFGGAVPEMMKGMVPTLDPKHMAVVQFKGPQNHEVLKTLRQSIINTMMLAENFIGSDIERALIEIGKVKEGDALKAQVAAFGAEAASASTDSGVPAQQQTRQPVQRKPEPVKEEPQPAMDFDSFDDEVPF